MNKIIFLSLLTITTLKSMQHEATHNIASLPTLKTQQPQKETRIEKNSHKKKLCPLCDKKIVNITRHMFTHTGEKPFTCTHSGCDYRCSDKSNLNRHISIHTGEKLYACLYEGCNQRFPASSDRSRHMLIHISEKSFACTYPGCSYRCSDKSNLNRHISMHSGEKPYACQHEGCGKRFSYKSSLIMHLRNHTGEKLYICVYPGCGKRFTRPNNRKIHIKRQHLNQSEFSSAQEAQTSLGKRIFKASDESETATEREKKRHLLDMQTGCELSITDLAYFASSYQAVTPNNFDTEFIQLDYE